jgi:hypothetical protein
MKFSVLIFNLKKEAFSIDIKRFFSFYPKMKVNFTPPDLILVFVVLQILAHFLFPIKQIIVYPLALVGILLIVVGQIPNFWLYFYFGKRKTTLKFTKLRIN